MSLMAPIAEPVELMRYSGPQRAAALSLDAIGLEPSDINLATAVLVALALIIPRLKKSRATA